MITLAFPLLQLSYAGEKITDTGFDFVGFSSNFRIDDSYVTALGALSVIELIASIVLIGISVYSAFKNVKKIVIPVIVGSLIVSLLYLIEGAVYLSKMGGGNEYLKTIGYVPFILIVFFIACYFGLEYYSKNIKNEKKETENNNESQPSPVTTENSKPTNVADELIKLKQLLDMGVITQEEFDKKKSELL